MEGRRGAVIRGVDFAVVKIFVDRVLVGVSVGFLFGLRGGWGFEFVDF